jgi:biotin synthase-related radical SAM superfamily protein
MKLIGVGKDLPRHIRVSIGSAIVLGIQEGKLDCAPTTAYLMTYRAGKCLANCGFCPQARRSYGRADMLSRVSWPKYLTEIVFEGIERAFKSAKIRRVCIQALNYPEVFADLLVLVEAIRSTAGVPASISCQPLNRRNLRELAAAGAERIGIPLDAATKEIFDKVKGCSVGGPYSWEKQFELLSEAIEFFGKGKVSTHLITGLGETEREMVGIIQKCVDMTVLPALFAFTPIPGTALQNRPQPLMQGYRRIQFARHLVLHGLARYEDMNFDEQGRLAGFGVSMRILKRIARTGEPFLTSGCPDCNRPYYNEKPSGPIYNFPREPRESELSEIEDQVFGTC